MFASSLENTARTQVIIELLQALQCFIKQANHITSLIPDPFVLFSSGFLILQLLLKFLNLFQAPSLLQGKPDHCSKAEGAAGSLQTVEFRAAENAIAKQRPPNQQQLARRGDGLGVGDSN